MRTAAFFTALALALPAAADGPLRLDLDTTIELNSFEYRSRQIYNASSQPWEIIVELADMQPHWFGSTGSPSAILAPGETYALAVASGTANPGAYRGTLRVRVIEPGADWPPLDGERYHSAKERARLMAGIVQELSIPVRYTAQ